MDRHSSKTCEGRKTFNRIPQLDVPHPKSFKLDEFSSRPRLSNQRAPHICSANPVPAKEQGVHGIFGFRAHHLHTHVVASVAASFSLCVLLAPLCVSLRGIRLDFQVSSSSSLSYPSSSYPSSLACIWVAAIPVKLHPGHWLGEGLQIKARAKI